MKSIKLLALAGLAGAAVLTAGCAESASNDGTATTTGSTVAQQCDPNGDFTAEIAKGVAELPDKWDWHTDDLAVNDPCADLSVVDVRVDMPTGSSPEGVLLFSRGQFVGNANMCAYQVAEIGDVDGDSVTVTYERGSDTEEVTYGYNGTAVTHTGYSAELKALQPTCDPTTGAWTDTTSSSTTAPTSNESTSCVNDLELDLSVPENGFNGTEDDGGLEYSLEVENTGSSSCRVMQKDIVLEISGAGNATCGPNVQGIEIKAGDEQELSSTRGAWGTCISDAVNGPGEYDVEAVITGDGGARVSSGEETITLK